MKWMKDLFALSYQFYKDTVKHFKYIAKIIFQNKVNLFVTDRVVAKSNNLQRYWLKKEKNHRSFIVKLIKISIL